MKHLSSNSNCDERLADRFRALYYFLCFIQDGDGDVDCMDRWFVLKARTAKFYADNKTRVSCIWKLCPFINLHEQTTKRFFSLKNRAKPFL